MGGRVTRIVQTDSGATKFMASTGRGEEGGCMERFLARQLGLHVGQEGTQ